MPATPKHLLPWPNQTDVADVPTDLKELAQQTEAALNTKDDPAQASSKYQSKVIVIVGTAANLPASGNPGDVVFLIS